MVEFSILLMVTFSEICSKLVIDNFIITGSEFSGNMATRGATLHLQNQDIIVKNSRFIGNQAYSGAAISILNESNTDFLFC